MRMHRRCILSPVGQASAATRVASVICVLALEACTSPCGGGTSLSDGLCVADPVDVPGMQDLVPNLPPCADAEGDGSLDLFKGCASGICSDMTLSEIEAAVGPGECTDQMGWVGLWNCYWSTGVSVAVEYPDGVPQRDVPVGGVFVDWTNTERTSDGLGIGVSYACFMQRLPVTTQYEFTRTQDGWSVGFLIWLDEVHLLAGFNADGMAYELDMNWFYR